MEKNVKTQKTPKGHEIPIPTVQRTSGLGKADTMEKWIVTVHKDPWWCISIHIDGLTYFTCHFSSSEARDLAKQLIVAADILEEPAKEASPPV